MSTYNKTEIIKISLWIFFIAISQIVFSQQLPQFTHYLYNTTAINPAYAGSKEALSIISLNRSQWVGVDNAPETYTFSSHVPLRDNEMGIGMSFIQDQIGVETFSEIYADYAYTIQTSRQNRLSFGIKVGFASYNLDPLFLNDPSVATDPYFANFSKLWTPNVGIGIYYRSQNKWFVGISSPKLFSSYLRESFQQRNINDFTPERAGYYLIGGAIVELNRSIKFRPSILTKTTNGSQLSFDLTSTFFFNEDAFSIGASYRFSDASDGFGFFGDVKALPFLRIGYSYDPPFFNNISALSSGTHELILSFELFKEFFRSCGCKLYF